MAACELSPEQRAVPGPEGSPDSVNSPCDIDRLLSEILNDPSIFSLIEAPSPAPCQSPSPQQLEQDALASLEQHQQLEQQPPAGSHRPAALELAPHESSRYWTPETPSPTTPSSTTSDHQAFFPPASSLPPNIHRPHPTSLSFNSLPASLPSHQLSPVQHRAASVLMNVEIAISLSVNDRLLRGQRGKVISLNGNGLTTVLIFSLNQECQVPVSSCDLVVPVAGDLVKMIDGPLIGMTGQLCNTNGGVSYIQLFDNSMVQVASNQVAKLSSNAVSTPSNGGSSMHLTSPSTHLPPSTTAAYTPSPLLSPVSLQRDGCPSLSLHSPHHSMNCGIYSPTTPGHLNTSSLPSYLPYPSSRQQARLPPYPSPTTHTATQRVCPTRQEIQRCRYLHQQQQQQQQEMMMMRRFRGVARSGGTNHHHTRGGRGVVSGGSEGNLVSSLNGKRPEQDIKSLIRYLDRPTQEIVEEIKAREMMEFDFGSTGDGGDLSSSCIQVPLICPLSQKRISLPCRGIQCKHPQCFDAEAYINFNKCVARPKDKKKNCSVSQSMKQQLFKCPLCSTFLPFSQLYIDKTLLQILQETEENEVEFDKTGSWKPVEKKSAEDSDVIDLTLENEEVYSQ